MERIKINGINLYKVTWGRDQKTIDKLIDSGYIIIYDEKVLNEGNKTLLAPSTLSTRQYYRLIKRVYPYGYAIYNMAETGFCSCDWYK